MIWKHRDSELDRTCGKPMPMFREIGSLDAVCRVCDGEIYTVDPR